MRKNTQLYIKITVFLLLSAFIFGFLPFSASAGSSKEMNTALFEKKLESFKSDVYANGSHYIDDASTYRGTQCYGFANQIAVYFYGSYPTTTSNGLQANADWVVNYGSAALMNVHIGDVVRFRSSVGADHSIFITGMDEEYLYFSDANNDHRNTVRHDAKKTWTELIGKIDKALEVNSKCIGWVAHYKYWNDAEEKSGVTVSYNANGGYIEGEKTADRYVVLTSALRMREGPGLDKIIRTRMLNGTYFDVPAGSDRVEADGYTWAPVTQGDLDGWAAISDPTDCRVAAPVMTSDYYVDGNGDIYENGAVNRYTEKLEDKAQFKIAEAFGLKLGNAEFLGWSTVPGGVPVKAEDIKESEDIIVLYAVWSESEETTDTESSPETTAPEETAAPDETTPAETTDGQSGEVTTDETTTAETAEATETMPETTPPETSTGDVNGDGSVNNKDISALFKLLGVPDTPYSPVNDINGDGSVNNKDVTCLFKSLSTQP